MVIERTFEVCSQGVAETRQTHATAFQVGNAMLALVTRQKAEVQHSVYLLEEGGRVVDTQTGAIQSCGNGQNQFELHTTKQ